MKIVPIFVLAALSAVSISTQAQMNKSSIMYPDTVEGLHDFLEAFIGAINSADAAGRARMEKSLAIPNKQRWFADVYGPTLGPELAGAYLPDLYPHLERQNLGPSTKIHVSRVQFASQQAAQSSEIPVVQLMVHPVAYYTAYLSWGDGDSLKVIYPLFIYVQGGFRLMNRQFGKIADHERPHCGLQDQMLVRLELGGRDMKQKLLSFPHPLAIPPGTREAAPATVKLLVLVGCDGTVLSTDYLDGPLGLFKAASAEAKKWKYGQTFLNSVPAEVVTTADMNFWNEPAKTD